MTCDCGTCARFAVRVLGVVAGQVALKLLLPEFLEPGIARVGVGLELEEVIVEADNVWRVELHRYSPHCNVLDIFNNIRSNVPSITETTSAVRQ